MSSNCSPKLQRCGWEKIKTGNEVLHHLRSTAAMQYSRCCKIVLMFYNALRICEVRIAETLKLNTNLNGVFHIYAVSKS